MACRHCVDNEPRRFIDGVGWCHPASAAFPGTYTPCGYQEAVGRAGDWMQTFTGRQFFVRDVRSEDIHILDIAAGLRNARYSSQSILTETVAEHSVLMRRVAQARGMSLRDQRTALMHDASEAYFVDIPRPIKVDLRDYLAIEDGIMRVIAQRFDFDWPIPPQIKELDNAILNDEFAQNMADPPAPWRQLSGGPLGVRIECWSPERAFVMFLQAASQVGVI